MAECQEVSTNRSNGVWAEIYYNIAMLATVTRIDTKQ